MPSSDKLLDKDGKSLDLLAPAPTATTTTSTNARRQVFETLRNMARSPSPPMVGQQKPSANVKTTDTQHSSTHKNLQKQKQKQKIVVPPIFQIEDAKLRDHAYAMQAIENKILRKRQNDVSVTCMVYCEYETAFWSYQGTIEYGLQNDSEKRPRTSVKSPKIRLIPLRWN